MIENLHLNLHGSKEGQSPRGYLPLLIGKAGGSKFGIFKTQDSREVPILASLLFLQSFLRRYYNRCFIYRILVVCHINWGSTLSSDCVSIFPIVVDSCKYIMDPDVS